MKSDASPSRRHFRHRAAEIITDRGATSHLRQTLCLTDPRSSKDQWRPRDERHAPAIVADIAVSALDREPGCLEPGGDLLLTVALQPDARAQLTVIRQCGADQSNQRVFQKAVTQAEAEQRRNVPEHADIGLEDIAQHELARGLQDTAEVEERGVELV